MGRGETDVRRARRAPSAAGQRQDVILLAVLFALHVALLVSLPVAAWALVGFLRRTGIGGGGPVGLVPLLIGFTVLVEIGLVLRSGRVWTRFREARRGASSAGARDAAGIDGQGATGSESPTD